MPIIKCPIPGCTYKTDDVDASIAVVLLTIHNNIHAAESAKSTINLPSISKGCDEDAWKTFNMRWFLYKKDCHLNPDEIVEYLLQCCDEALVDDILKVFPQGFTGTEDELLAIIKRFVLSSATARRAQLISLKQNLGESVRNFVSRINEMATTCDYPIECTCIERSNLLTVIMKDVLVAGLANDDIKKKVFEWSELDDKNIDDVICFVESQELLHDSLDIQHNGIIDESMYETKDNSVSSMDTTHEYPIKDVVQIDSVSESFLPNPDNVKHQEDFYLEECYKCSLCDKSFLKRRDLEKHYKFHVQNGEKPYTCDVCSKSFTLRESLHKHSRRFHTAGGVNKSHVCKVCNKAFLMNYELKRHERLKHTVEKPYVCEVCGYRCKLKDNMKVHSKVHTGEKPYKCDICGRGFAQSGNLLRHSKTHSKTPKKFFKCEKCNADFKRKVDLDRHNDKYNGEIPFSCKMCDTSVDSCAIKHHCHTLKTSK